MFTKLTYPLYLDLTIFFFFCENDLVRVMNEILQNIILYEKTKKITFYDKITQSNTLPCKPTTPWVCALRNSDRHLISCLKYFIFIISNFIITSLVCI